LFCLNVTFLVLSTHLERHVTPPFATGVTLLDDDGMR
jgi:hypothetical protein